MSDSDWRVAGDRIEALIAAGATPGAAGRDRAEELVRLVADLYGAGLERMLEVLHAHGALGDEVLDALAADDLVASLLLVHGLHPYDARTRVEQALAGLPGDITLLGITAEGVARLRMAAGHGGCSAPPAAGRPEIEEAVEASAPEVTAIEIEEPAAGGPVIPVSALFARLGEAPGPISGPEGARLADAPGPISGPEGARLADASGPVSGPEGARLADASGPVSGAGAGRTTAPAAT